MLEAAGLTVVAEAADGFEAIGVCKEVCPDLMILDIGLPRLSGIDAAVLALHLERPPAVIILGVHDDEAYIKRSLAVGARAYLLKSSADQDLVPAVHAVAEGKPFLSPAISAVLVDDYLRRMRQSGLTDSYHLLSDGEKEVLQLLAEGRSCGEVAHMLGVGLSTAERHRTTMMQKLSLHSAAEVVLYAVRKKLLA